MRHGSSRAPPRGPRPRLRPEVLARPEPERRASRRLAGRRLFRPGPERHSIYDLVLHTAYWKYSVRRRLTGEKRGSFALEGSNFFPAPPRSTAKEVAAAKLLLEREHRELRQAVEDLPDGAFRARLGRWTAEAVIAGAAAHDVYHAGQIQLLKRLHGERRRG